MKTQMIKLNKIKHIENSRLRETDDVSDLMIDIQQRGLLQPVGIREADNALIFGNRRVKAYEKLDYKEIECVLFDDVSDEDLILMNLVENIKRKNIGSIEVGRMCKILMKKGLTHSEISAKLGISKSRVASSISCYSATVGTPFEKLIVFGKLGKNRKGIPESLIWKINDSLKRAIGRKISTEQWNILLTAAEQGKITGHNLSALRSILMTQEEIDIETAIAVLDESKVVYCYMNMNRKVLNEEMKKHKFQSDIEFVKNIVKQYNKDLFF